MPYTPAPKEAPSRDGLPAEVDIAVIVKGTIRVERAPLPDAATECVHAR